MNLFDIFNTEDNPLYQSLEIENGNRQYDFLRSIVEVSVAVDRPFLSQSVIKALNFHAIACLHAHAGDYRPCEVEIGEHRPPAFWRVPSLMEDFINDVNRQWEKVDAIGLAAYVLWRLNWIHPFINGNGRTARATAYFALCVSSGGWLSGAVILPALLKRERGAQDRALELADASYARGNTDLRPLIELISRLLEEQLASIPAEPEGGSPA
jgi:Fic family protein